MKNGNSQVAGVLSEDPLGRKAADKEFGLPLAMVDCRDRLNGLTYAPFR